MELVRDFLLPCLWAFLACLGFCFLFDIHGVGMLLCALGGAAGWLTYLAAGALGCDTLGAACVAGMFISAWSETMARIRKCPVSGYLLIAYFPPVPGAGLYYSMEYFLNGDSEGFAASMREVLAMAGGLAVGVLLVSSLVRTINSFYRARRRAA